MTCVQQRRGAIPVFGVAVASCCRRCACAPRARVGTPHAWFCGVRRVRHRYAAKTENERIQQAIASRGVVAGADTRWDATALHPSYRQVDKRKWKGQLFRSMSTPTDLRLQSVSGARPARPNSCLETFKPPISALLRERIPEREVHTVGVFSV